MIGPFYAGSWWVVEGGKEFAFANSCFGLALGAVNWHQIPTIGVAWLEVVNDFFKEFAKVSAHVADTFYMPIVAFKGVVMRQIQLVYYTSKLQWTEFCTYCKVMLQNIFSK